MKIELTEEQQRVFVTMAIGAGVAPPTVGHIILATGLPLADVERILNELHALGLVAPPADWASLASPDARVPGVNNGSN
jgi:hypothetical protein